MTGVSEDSGLFEAAADAEATAEAVAAAAPLAPERGDTAAANAVPAELRAAMTALLSTLADNKYVLGRRYAEWCTGAPMLESAVAAAAMAQDELGHARSFYPLLRGFEPSADSMEEKGWQNRRTQAVACLDQRFGGWVDFVAANVVVDSAFTTLLAAASDSPYEPLRQRARKIVQEEAAHWVHGSGWLRRLAREGHQAALQRAVEQVWDDAFTWFGQADDPTFAPLAAHGLLDADPHSFRSRLEARLQPVLEQAGLTSVFQRDLPWARWDPTVRRLR